MRVAAIMQPTYLPWIGYFDLMDQVDIFVFLDSVAFSRQSWQQRNRIVTPTGLQWLTVPVLHKGRFGQRICDVPINRTAGFPDKHIKTIEQNYSRAVGFDRVFDPFVTALRRASEAVSLADLNIAMIAWLRQQVGVATETTRSSEFGLADERSDLLVGILKAVGAQRYLSVPGSTEYIQRDAAIYAEAGIAVQVHAFEDPVYDQVYGAFTPKASLLDLLFNAPDTAGELMRSGRRAITELA